MDQKNSEDNSELPSLPIDVSSDAPRERHTTAESTETSGSLDDSGQTTRKREVRIVGERAILDPEPIHQAETPVPDVPDASGDGQAPEAGTSRKTTTTHRVSPLLQKQEVVKGRQPGDRFIRYARNTGPFKRTRSNVLSASLEASAPRSGFGKLFDRVKRVVIGAPISSELSMHERLTNVKALAVLSSDPLSSVAYATEEILRILILASLSATALAMPLGLGVMALLAVVATSYRQTIAAYPRGGGSYIVAKDNLGTIPGLTAAASILIGYVLTVSVSVSAGVAALYSLYPEVKPYRVGIAIALVILVTVANLRGIREAGNIFAVPTYLFILGMFALIIYGALRIFFGIGGVPVYERPEEVVTAGGEALTIFLVLRAFTQGCTALTGVEAIADGVPAFKPPEAKNAISTLTIMAAMSITMFGGITFLATQLGVQPSETETVVSQIARTIFGDNILWYAIQIATALILVLAANTAFADFPRLSYFLANDKFMPHQYAFRGDRLAFSWGIVTLAIVACVLIWVFGGDTSALIPLYAIGVFGAFTFSQAGMVMRWWRMRTEGWRRNLTVNALGALVTGAVLLISIVTKFFLGAWIALVLIPILIGLFLAINRHYRLMEGQVAATTPVRREDYKHTFVVPVARLNPVALSALAYARSLSTNVTAVHIVEGEDYDAAETFNEEWRTLVPDQDIPLVLIESPYRSLLGPLLSYIDALDQQSPDDVVTVVVPEFLPSSPWEYLLHNQSALRLKAALLFRPNTIVVNLPYRLGKAGARLTGATSIWSHFPVVPAVIGVAILIALYFILYT